MEKNKELFKKYVNKFNMKDSGISLKYYHSLRVMDYSIILAKDNNLNEEDTKIITLVGLLHDYGRFYQWTKYHTFNDLISIGHADYGVYLLFERKEIENYDIDKDDYDIIYKAIKYHNKLQVPDTLNEREKLLCNIIRDADKIDIFYLISTDKMLIKEDEEEISDIVKETFFKHLPVVHKDEKNYNDKVVSKFSYLFDIKYKRSLEIIRNNKSLDNLYMLLDNKERFKIYYDECIKYINERLSS